MPRHLLEVLEAGVDLEGLSERDAGLLAEPVAVQAAEKRGIGFDESSAFKRSRTLSVSRGKSNCLVPPLDK